MASKHSRSNSDRPIFSAATPHFFTVILENTLKTNRLLIPKKFWRKHGKSLSNPVLVKLPCGSEWQMELRKFEGSFCLGKGWQGFAKHYSIGLGYFLVFEYEGNSRFNALIFDRTTVEIDYPLVPSRIDEPNQEEHKDDESLEILEEVPSCPRKRKSSQSPCSWRHKKLRSSPINEAEINLLSKIRLKGTRARGTDVKLEASVSYGHSECLESKIKGKLNLATEKGEKGKSTAPKPMKCEVVQKMQQVTAEGRVESYQRASGFKSENLTCTVSMKPSHITHYDMSLPCHFARAFLADRRTCDAVLKNSEGRTWPGKLFNRRNRGPRFQQLGWKNFLQDNNLKLGDICTFELIDTEKMSFRVYISRAADVSNSQPTYGKFSLRRTSRMSEFAANSSALKAASRFSSIYPFFKNIVFSSHIAHSTHRVPADIGRRFFGILVKRQNVTLQVGKSSWSVDLCCFPPYSYLFDSRGWSKFARENSLSLGDVCVYELVKESNIVLNVSIFRAIN